MIPPPLHTQAYVHGYADKLRLRDMRLMARNKYQPNTNEFRQWAMGYLKASRDNAK
jgi:hypothetical protein